MENERNKMAWVTFLDYKEQIYSITPEDVIAIESDEGVTSRVRRKARRLRDNDAQYAVVGVDPMHADQPWNQLEYLPPRSNDWKPVHDIRDGLTGEWYTGMKRETPTFYAMESASDNPAAAREKFHIIDGADIECAKRAATRQEQCGYSKYMYLGQMRPDGRIEVLLFKRPWGYRWEKVERKTFVKNV